MSRLDEQQRRRYVAVESARVGQGGHRRLSRITGMNFETIRRGRRELNESLRGRPSNRVRLPGGRRHSAKKVPDAAGKPTELVEAETGVDPMSRRDSVRISLRHLGGLLRGRGVSLCRGTVGRLLRGLGFSLRANQKRLTGPPHPERDRQFGYIGRVRRRFLKAGPPVLGVDARKKELVDDFKDPGRDWQREADPVNTHDFPQDASHRAAPYGVYDLRRARGHVAVETSADTAEFAVDAIASWWEEHGSKSFPGAGKIPILADAGGSNGYRDRLQKLRLREHLVERLGLGVTVCHYPSGATKWNW